MTKSWGKNWKFRRNLKYWEKVDNLEKIWKFATNSTLKARGLVQKIFLTDRQTDRQTEKDTRS